MTVVLAPAMPGPVHSSCDTTIAGRSAVAAILSDARLRWMLVLLVVLQAVQVVILWLHDWVPLGVLNDVRAIRAADSPARLVRITLVQSIPWTIGLFFTLQHLATPFPHWLWWWLWISYGILFVGELRAWWVPYLIRSEPGRAARYRAMFGRTHAFLPQRNGMTPNTLHAVLHACTAATLLTLTFLTLRH